MGRSRLYFLESECDSQDGGVHAGTPEPVWLAAYTRPHFEAKVREFLDARGFQTFLPCHLSWQRWSDRKKVVERPLFPSYVFALIDGCQRHRAVQAPGFLWFVHNRSGPIVVEAPQLQAVR